MAQENGTKDTKAVQEQLKKFSAENIDEYIQASTFQSEKVHNVSIWRRRFLIHANPQPRPSAITSHSNSRRGPSSANSVQMPAVAISHCTGSPSKLSLFISTWHTTDLRDAGSSSGPRPNALQTLSSWRIILSSVEVDLSRAISQRRPSNSQTVLSTASTPSMRRCRQRRLCLRTA